MVDRIQERGLAPLSKAMTQVAMETKRAMNREKFAGSGWEHFGRGYSASDSEPINEGLFTRNILVNGLYIGRRNTNVQGNSKTDFATMQMAGFSVDLINLNRTENSSFIAELKFPEAPTGAVTYDSATGTVFDFEAQSDPKYGNIAPDRNEAVARAFEGFVSNGDFRLGDNGDWLHSESGGSTVTVTTNGAVYTQGSNINSILRTSNLLVSAGQTWDLSVTYEVVTAFAGSAPMQGGLGTASSALILPVDSEGVFTVTGQQSFTGTAGLPLSIRGFSATDGARIRVISASARLSTNEVVTRRVDMWGFEGFLEEVTESNPFVYPNGLIQSQATTMNGVPTVQGTRPVTYYAVFDGDTTSVGRGVDFFAATEAQQNAMLTGPKNNLYRLDDGRLVQFRVRQRTIAGAGNGDWRNVFVTHRGSSFDQFLTFNINGEAVNVQGFLDSNTPLTRASGNTFATTPLQQSQLAEEDIGAFRSWNGPQRFGVNGECYFLVGGTVSRLNQGAYHPELNSFGSAMWGGFDSANPDNPAALAFRYTWISSGTFPSYGSSATTQLQAFTRKTTSLLGLGEIGDDAGRTNDGRFHNAIYANGLGGVVDYRWSANDRSDPKWGAQAKLEAEAGEYRGLELLQRTHIQTATQAATGGGTAAFDGLDTSRIEVGDTAYCQNAAGNYEQVTITQSLGNGTVAFAPNITGRLANSLIVITSNLDISVSGNFTRTDAIGDPVNLLATFPAGFEGGWIDTIPNGNTMNFVLARKDVSGNPEGVRTTNNGGSWSGDGLSGFNTATNANPANYSATTVNLVSYTADAKKTRRSTNVELFNAYSGQYGVTAVAFFSPGWGALLFESMLGKVATSTSSINGIIQTYPFTLLNLRSVNGLIEDFVGRESRHSPLTLATPTNDSRGIKYAAHQVDDNGQATLNFIFNELDHDGTDWGDDGRLRVLNGTYTNQNGVTGLLANVDELAIPYGLIKNEV